jgi:catechol 2,3-dioxygenase-like lactoylglutathione lyase family enzyme
MTRLVGINHVALEVGNLDEALAFYGSLFELTLRGRSPEAAFIDMGDQFLALMEARAEGRDRVRHFGLVVDDKEATRRALEAAGVEIRPGRGLDFLDPWGNFVQVVQYDEVQFTKTDNVLRGMGLELDKTDAALAELRAKGLA